MRPEEIAIVTCYFNPSGYQTRRRNYVRFMEGMRDAGALCITLECAFGEAPFELPHSLDVIRVRAESLLWQKERLLNLAAQALPKTIAGVAWLDCDIVFQNKMWLRDLATALTQYPIAQVFETAVRLNEHGEHGDRPDRVQSFAHVMRTNPTALAEKRYDAHGHTGYGWAMRREIFDTVGLYPLAISGSADHFMAHAIYNDHGFCVRNALKNSHAQIEHLRSWVAHFYPHVRGSLGCVPGEIEHLWHGDLKHRRYFLRMHEITDLGYDPYTDIEVPHGEPLRWSQRGRKKHALCNYFENYFRSRKEDGES